MEVAVGSGITTVIEGIFSLVVGVLALGCIRNWVVEWRHDSQGRIFLTAVTILAVLMVTWLVVDMVTQHGLLSWIVSTITQ